MTPTDRPTDHTPTDRPTDHTDRTTGRSQPRILTAALPVALWSLTILVTFLALSGQVEFAVWAGITDWRKWLAPAGLELVAIVFLLVGYRRALRGDSPITMWLLAATVGGFAVWTNVVHAGERAGPIFGLFTAIAVILWFVKLADDYRQHRRAEGTATKARPKFGALWLVAPRLTTRAWIIAVRLQITTVAVALMYAELWRAVRADAKAAGLPRRLRTRTAWRTVMQTAGHPVADLPARAEVATVKLVNRPEPTSDEGGRSDGTDRPVRRRPTRRPTSRSGSRRLRLV